MQITGSQCTVCQGKINSSINGIGCNNCQKVFHFNCLPDKTVCPHCGLNFADTNRKIEEKKTAEARMAGNDGKLMLILFIIFYILLEVLVLIRRPTIRNFIDAFLMMLLLYFLYIGKRFAKILITVLTILSGIVGIISVSLYPNLVGIILVCCMTGFIIFFIYALHFNKSMQVFLAEQSRRH